VTEAKNVLQEIDEAILQGSPESRARALWHATDILIAGRYTEDQIWVFGEVIGRLADEIEGAARAKLARQLAHSSNAPFNVILVLASDDSIDVAGPVLQHSERLDDKMLVASTRTKSQAHLLAISKRRSIPVVVTDELVSRGNREVVHSIAVNTGARFSDFGFLQMIKRSEGDSVLAEHIGLRKEIPRHMFQQLIAKASDDVKRKLEQGVATGKIACVPSSLFCTSPLPLSRSSVVQRVGVNLSLAGFRAVLVMRKPRAASCPWRRRARSHQRRTSPDHRSKTCRRPTSHA
jgi:Uncharacterised protein conserved in bacteria (DUF2336)